MNIRNRLLILFLLVSIMIGFVCSLLAMTNNGAKVPNRDEVIILLRNAITHNEDFKKSVGSPDYKKLRDEIEEFNDEVLFPKMTDVKVLLSTGKDISLATEFFTLVISYENSANETLSYTMGEIFLSNPDLMEETFDVFDKTKQEILYKQLKWGWDNVVFQKNKSDEKVLLQSQRLHDLKNKIDAK